jgi:hypothetical protein
MIQPPATSAAPAGVFVPSYTFTDAELVDQCGEVAALITVLQKKMKGDPQPVLPVNPDSKLRLAALVGVFKSILFSDGNERALLLCMDGGPMKKLMHMKELQPALFREVDFLRAHFHERKNMYIAFNGVFHLCINRHLFKLAGFSSPKAQDFLKKAKCMHKTKQVMEAIHRALLKYFARDIVRKLVTTSTSLDVSSGQCRALALARYKLMCNQMSESENDTFCYQVMYVQYLSVLVHFGKHTRDGDADMLSTATSLFMDMYFAEWHPDYQQLMAKYAVTEAQDHEAMRVVKRSFQLVYHKTLAGLEGAASGPRKAQRKEAAVVEAEEKAVAFDEEQEIDNNLLNKVLGSMKSDVNPRRLQAYSIVQKDLRKVRQVIKGFLQIGHHDCNHSSHVHQLDDVEEKCVRVFEECHFATPAAETGADHRILDVDGEEVKGLSVTFSQIRSAMCENTKRMLTWITEGKLLSGEFRRSCTVHARPMYNLC